MGYSRKKNKQQELRTYVFDPTSSLEFLGFFYFTPWNSRRKWLYPWKLHKIVLLSSKILRPKTRENFGNSLGFFFDDSWKFHVVFNWPLENLLAISTIPLEIPYSQPPLLDFFLEWPHINTKEAATKLKILN